MALGRCECWREMLDEGEIVNAWPGDEIAVLDSLGPGGENGAATTTVEKLSQLCFCLILADNGIDAGGWLGLSGSDGAGG